MKSNFLRVTPEGIEINRGATANLSHTGSIVSTVVVIICPVVEIGLTLTQNLGKARALEVLVAVAPLRCGYFW